LPGYRKEVWEVRIEGDTGVLVRFRPEQGNRALYENNIAAVRRLQELGVGGPRLLYRDDEKMEFVTTHVGEQLDEFLARQVDRPAAERAIAGAVQYVAAVNRADACDVEFRVPEYVARILAGLEHCTEEQRASFWSRLPGLRMVVVELGARWTHRRLREGAGMTDLHISNLALDTDGRIAMFDFDHFRPHYNLNYLLSYISVTLGWAMPQRWQHLPAYLDAQAETCEGWEPELYAYGKIACHTTKLLDRYLPETVGKPPAVPSTTQTDVERAIEQVERIAEGVLSG